MKRSQKFRIGTICSISNQLLMKKIFFLIQMKSNDFKCSYWKIVSYKGQMTILQL